MALQVCFYEDAAYSQFFPLTYLRPVYLLRAGMVPLYRRAQRFFPDSTSIFLCRSQISTLLSEQAPEFPVNIIKRPTNGGDILFLNGRIRSYGDLPKLVRESRLSTIFRNGKETIGLLLKEDVFEQAPSIATQTEYIALFEKERETIPDFDTTATLYSHLWDIMADIEPEVTADFNAFRSSFTPKSQVTCHPGAALVGEENIFLDDGVVIMPGAVIDASHGPVYVGANTKIESHAAIYGPSFIGANSVIVAGKITGCSIGHTCRVGGEVEESVFHAYVNKYHAGFIGHSYVGPWVNFGAMTTNSDLKNNYSVIRCSLDGKDINTGSIKVGSFIGDHTKFGIGTLLNTGITIGVCCNLFGGTLIADKEVASYQWGNTGNYEVYRFDKAIETARKAVERRNCSLSEREIALLKAVFDKRLVAEGVLSF
jgi:UDP-N-acetylglucosamine diphosphorylase/glucosamine-1-phosphate N-acetyltransferase